VRFRAAAKSFRAFAGSHSLDFTPFSPQERGEGQQKNAEEYALPSSDMSDRSNTDFYTLPEQHYRKRTPSVQPGSRQNRSMRHLGSRA
jgi:hypothetical protein